MCMRNGAKLTEDPGRSTEQTCSVHRHNSDHSNAIFISHPVLQPLLMSLLVMIGVYF